MPTIRSVYKTLDSQNKSLLEIMNNVQSEINKIENTLRKIQDNRREKILASLKKQTQTLNYGNFAKASQYNHVAERILQYEQDLGSKMEKEKSREKDCQKELASWQKHQLEAEDQKSRSIVKMYNNPLIQDIEKIEVLIRQLKYNRKNVFSRSIRDCFNEQTKVPDFAKIKDYYLFIHKFIQDGTKTGVFSTFLSPNNRKINQIHELFDDFEKKNGVTIDYFLLYYAKEEGLGYRQSLNSIKKSDYEITTLMSEIQSIKNRCNDITRNQNRIKENFSRVKSDIISNITSDIIIQKKTEVENNLNARLHALQRIQNNISKVTDKLKKSLRKMSNNKYSSNHMRFNENEFNQNMDRTCQLYRDNTNVLFLEDDMIDYMLLSDTYETPEVTSLFEPDITQNVSLAETQDITPEYDDLFNGSNDDLSDTNIPDINVPDINVPDISVPSDFGSSSSFDF